MCLLAYPRSHEILMFVFLLKEAKQCCDATELHCTHRKGLRGQIVLVQNMNSVKLVIPITFIVVVNSHQR